MRTERSDQRWRELSWRGKLTPVEQASLRAWLAQHPEAQPEWEAEAVLTEALERLPDVAVPSNFTERVLQTAGRQAAAGARWRWSAWLAWGSRLRWLPKPALALLILGGSLVSYNRVLAFQLAQLAKSVVAISHVTTLPSPSILTNFDAIQVMDRTPPADLELLQLLK